MTVAKGGKFTTVYIGYGLKHGASSYNPVEPPVVQADPDETAEKDEPNPKHSPREVPKEVEEGNDSGAE